MPKQTRSFLTFSTKEEAIVEMKRMRKRKYTINYSESGKCWIAWFYR